jgi:Carbohydrate family 9 binding domain-like
MAFARKLVNVLRSVRLHPGLWALLALATLASSALNLNSSSPYSWATYYAPKRVNPVTIDGNLDEWGDVKGFTMDQEKFFFVGQGMSSSKWQGPKDLSATFKVMWDEKYIYVAVHVVDDHVTEPHGSFAKGMDTGSWDDDGVELMFDNDGCNMSRYYVGDPMHHEFHFVFSEKHPFVFDNFWRYQQGASQPMFTLPDGTLEPLAYPDEVMAKNDITQSFAGPPYNGSFAFKRNSDGYNLEVRMALPGAQMRPIYDGGHAIGFDVAINDNDEGKGPLKQQLHWSGMNDLFWRDTKFFGTLFLYEAPLTKSSNPSAVPTCPRS